MFVITSKDGMKTNADVNVEKISLTKKVCNAGFIFYPDIGLLKGQYLDVKDQYMNYKNCVCRNSIVDKLVEENKIYNETLNIIPSNECASCKLYIVLFAGFLTTNVMIDSAFIYFHWYKNINS